MGKTEWSDVIEKDADMSRYLYFMAASMCIGIRTYKRIQRSFSSPLEFYEADRALLEKAGILSLAQLDRITEAKKVINPAKDYEYSQKIGVRLIPIDSAEYPYRLKEIKDPPPILFLKGTLPKDSLPMVAVVGARECSSYGANVAKKLGERLGQYNIPVISGMARGIDSIAERAALEGGGYSMALLGGGVDIVYPKESSDLYDVLSKRGGILSEFPPGTYPQKQYFALRNRLISGLSDAVCVVEAKEKSGTLITVDCALDQGREVFAVPGRITDITSNGTNELIRQGAGMITDIDAFVNEFAGSCTNMQNCDIKDESSCQEPEFSGLSNDETEIIRFADDNSFTIDEMSSKTGISSGNIILACVSLTKMGAVSAVGGGRFIFLDKGLKIKKSLTTDEE